MSVEGMVNVGRLLRCGLLAAVLASESRAAWALKFHATLDPIRIYEQPGQVFNRNFTLKLARDEHRARFKIRTEDWWRSEDGKQSFYRAPGTLARSCASWVRLNPVETAVEPGGVLEVRITIAIPADARPGGVLVRPHHRRSA